VTATPPSVTGPYVGTSGFSYPSWRGGFYPDGAKPAEFLRFYSERLPSVELNNSFYRVPTAEQFARWGDATPPGFRFAVKLPMAITIFGRLDQVGDFGERIQGLGDRLGPLLVRLGDGRPRDDGFLRLLLGSLDPSLDVAIDARHESWAEADPVLAELGSVRVNALDADAPFRYLRFRDPPYDDEALAVRADRIRGLLDDGVRVYAYFKHEDEPTGPRYAARLLELLGR
jgi:uncharacterized protein YecE (DUF72 family)